MKLSISKYSSFTKVQFVDQYQNPHFCNIDKIYILLQKFNLLTHIKTCIFDILIEFLFCYKSSICSPKLELSFFKYSFATKVQFVHPYQNLQFWNIDQILFCYKSSFWSSTLKLSISKYSSVSKVQFVHQYQISILLQKFDLFTGIKFAFFIYWLILYFVTKVQFVHPN